MTVNTLMKEEELRELPHFLAPYYEQGLDGVTLKAASSIGSVPAIVLDFSALLPPYSVGKAAGLSAPPPISAPSDTAWTRRTKRSFWICLTGAD